MYTLSSDVKIGVNAPLFRESIASIGVYETLKALNGLGVHYLENSMMDTEPETIDAIYRACNDFGMEMCSMTADVEAMQMPTRPGMRPRRPNDNLEDNWDKVIAYMKKLGCNHLRTVTPPRDTWASIEGIESFAKKADMFAKRLESEGITYSYHTHPAEMARFGERQGLYILKDLTEKLGFELCTYWITFGGLSLEKVIRDFTGRGCLFHLKDHRIPVSKPGTGGGHTIETAEVGEGNQNLEYIIKLADECGRKFMFVEQDNKCGRTEFECISTSYKNMYSWGYGTNM